MMKTLQRYFTLLRIVTIIFLLILGEAKSGWTRGSRWVSRTVTVTASYYCPCSECTDGDGKTSTGRSAYKDGIATFDATKIATGCYIDLPNSTLGPNGNGSWIKVDDKGPERSDRDIDIRLQDHEQCKKKGVKKLRIRIWEEN